MEAEYTSQHSGSQFMQLYSLYSHSQTSYIPPIRLANESAYAGERNSRIGSFVGSMPSLITSGSKLIFSHAAPSAASPRKSFRYPTITLFRSTGHTSVGLSSGSPG